MRHPWPAELKKGDGSHFRRNRIRNPHNCLRNMNQKTWVGDRARRRIFPSITEKWWRIHENSIEKPEDTNFLTRYSYGHLQYLIFSNRSNQTLFRLDCLIFPKEWTSAEYLFQSIIKSSFGFSFLTGHCPSRLPTRRFSCWFTFLIP
jgi:hypothetical protein